MRRWRDSAQFSERRVLGAAAALAGTAQLRESEIRSGVRRPLMPQFPLRHGWELPTSLIEIVSNTPGTKKNIQR